MVSAAMPRSRPVDGFSLEYDRAGSGAPVVLLHGWPGSRSDQHAVAALLEPDADVVVPDLRGFGGSDRHDRDPAEAYSADAQADSVCGLIEELGLDRPVIAGYDIGSRVAQAVARRLPDDLRGLVLCPPLPGVGERILEPGAQREFWYQQFHALALSERLIDGDARAVRAYLEHFWEHWSGPGWTPEPERLDALTELYARPGAFRASIAWYRAGAGAVARSLAERPPAPLDRVAVPATVLWPEYDPLFPQAWSDRIDSWFADAELRMLDGAGHYVPVEAPDAMADAIRERLRPSG
jgi:pimeloyl-ACP methyl ester carboxylesterase